MTALLATSAPTRLLVAGNARPSPSEGIDAASAPRDMDLVDVVADELPEVVLLDLATLEVDPLRLCRTLAEQVPSTDIVGTGVAERVGDGYQLLRLGATSWVTLTDSAAGSGMLATAVEATARGEAIFHRRHAAWILADYERLGQPGAGVDPRRAVTPTEREVLTRLAAGDGPEEVAAHHGVTTHEVSRHARMALARLRPHFRR